MVRDREIETWLLDEKNGIHDMAPGITIIGNNGGVFVQKLHISSYSSLLLMLGSFDDDHHPLR